MDAAQIKSRLNDRIGEFCQYLFPAGRTNGGHFEIGDVGGTAGQSLKVTQVGKYAGSFTDFQDRAVKGNNLIELLRQVRGCTFSEALRECKQWLGVGEDEPWARAQQMPRQSTLTRLASGGKKRLEDELKPVVEGSAVWKWLTEERKISPSAIKAYKVGEARIQKDGRDCVVFPFFNADGRLCRLKFRDISDKKYQFQTPKKEDGPRYEMGAQLHLFGIQGVPDNAGSLIITEGEIDALSFASEGFPAVSLPIGAQANDTAEKCSHDSWIENDFAFLERFTEINLALDADEPGQAATKILIPRLGRERVYVCSFHEAKDANECLQKGVELRWILESAQAQDPAELKQAGAFEDAIWERFYPSSGKPLGEELPWNIGNFRLRPGEVTVWHGYNGHGKSVALGHVLIHLAAQGRKSCLASLEMPAPLLLQNMIRQSICKIKPRADDGKAEFHSALCFLDEFIYLYDFVGSAVLSSVLDCWSYAAKKYGVQYFVLDSLMKLSDIAGTDYDAQKAVMNTLNAFAKDFNVHVFLVAHSKKPTSDRPKEKFPPSELDISGSGDIPNGAWNVICCWRNEARQIKIERIQQWLAQGWMPKYDQRTKQEARQELNDEMCAALKQDLYDTTKEANARIEIQKDRVGGQFPMPKNLWFDSESWQYGETWGFPPKKYLEA